MEQYMVKDSQLKYSGTIVKVVQDTVVLPNGKNALREVVVRGEAAAVVPVDDAGNIVFVRQYRHAVRRETLEVPAGMLEADEKPLDCAMRELQEETGLKTSNIQYVLKMHSSIGFCTEALYIYMARGFTVGKQNLDPEEFVTVERYSIDKAVDMIYSGDITDGKTIAAVFACKDILSRKG